MKRISVIFILMSILNLHVFSVGFEKIIFNPDLEFEKQTTNIIFSTISLKGYASFWVQKSSGSSYLLPEIIEKNIFIETQLKIYNSLQYVDFKTIKLNSLQEIYSEITFYSVCSALGDIKCKDYYFITQVNINGIANSFCGGYFNEKDFVPFPVLFCAGYDQNYRIGITLHRTKY